MDYESDFDTFESFPKIARLYHEIVITEKIDGTNAQVCVSDDGNEVRAGSRNRWIFPGQDNHGFAKWVGENAEELKRLGPGRHFGEWWGSGIQRGYGLKKGEKRFSLFNVHRWGLDRPPCCHMVPVIQSGEFSAEMIDRAMAVLVTEGSLASPGFDMPEGIVIYHKQGNILFKSTFNGDGHKG